jgi:hypothetical protein
MHIQNKGARTMIVVAIVGTLFAALAVGSVWLRTQDPDELREMGVVLGYKDEHAGSDGLVGVQQQHELTQRAHVRTTQMPKGPLKTAPRAFAHTHVRQH